MKRALTLLVAVLATAGCTEQPPLATPAPAASPAAQALPALRPRLTLVAGAPWRRVDADWQLVMTLSGPHPEGVPDPEEARIELLSPTGRRTALARMDRTVLAGSPVRKDAWPFPTIEDFSAADRTVLLLFHAEARDATAVSLDLVSGEQRRARVPIGTSGLVLRDEGFVLLDGRGRLVSAGWDGTTSPLARTTGRVLPLADRSGVVVSRPLRVVRFDGSVRPLAAPAAGRCEPRRWWRADAVLATCGGGSAWSVPLDGSSAREVARPAPNSETGLDDAVRVRGETYVQELEGCSGAWLARVLPDGTAAAAEGTRGQRLVGVVGERLLVEPATSCGTVGGSGGGLALLDPGTLATEPLLRLGRDEVLRSVRPWGGWPEPIA